MSDPTIPTGGPPKPSAVPLAQTDSALKPTTGSRRYGTAKPQSQFNRCRRAEWKLVPTCLSTLFRKITWIFSRPPSKASLAALASELRSASADMAAKLRDGHPASLAAAVRSAGEAARQFEQAGGDLQREILHCIRNLAENHRGMASPDDLPTKDACRKPLLEALATAFNSGTVSEAIAQIEPDDAASLELLTRFESLVQQEMVGMMYRSIHSTVDFAAQTIRAGRPSVHVATALRFAFDSAQPVIRQSILPDNEQTALIIAGKIREVLCTHPATIQSAVLEHVDSADLRRLAQVAGQPPGNLIQHEIRTRGERLTQRFCDAANRLDTRKSECLQYFAELLQAGRACRELENHCSLHGLPMPAAALAAKQRTQESLATIPYLDIDLMALSDQDLAEAVTVTKTMTGSPALYRIGNTLARLTYCQYRHISESLSVALFSAHYVGQDFQALLDSLGVLERNLRPVISDGPREPQAKLAWIQRQMEISGDKHTLLNTENKPLASAPLMPLLNGLRQAAVAARETARPELAQRYEDMALILDAMIHLFRADTAAGRMRVPGNAADAAERTDLTPAEYGRLFAIDVSNPSHPELHSGDVEPHTTFIIQSHLDQLVSHDDTQGNRQINDDLVVSNAFYQEGMSNAVRCGLVEPDSGAGTPLIDGGGWDRLTELQRTSRLAAGYRKLIDFCGGDKAQARRLSLLVGQAIPDVLARVCYATGGASPFHMPGGGWGNWLSGTKPSRQYVVLNLSKSSQNRIRIRVEMRREGGGVYVGNEPRKLTPNSYTQIAIEAELHEDGALLLTAAPAYRFYLQRDFSASPATLGLQRRSADNPAAFAETDH